jgi:two-component sensor histidine kinase
MLHETQDRLTNFDGISAQDREKLAGIVLDMPIVADISRSDLVLYARRDAETAVVVGQARPHSIMPVYSDDLLGYRVDSESGSVVFRALRWGRRFRGSQRLIAGGAPVIQEVWPVRGSEGKIIAGLSIEANLIAYVRQKSRSKVFQRAVRVLQRMLLAGELKNVEALSPFGERDGILVVDYRRIARYASGIATDHYRKLGYLDTLVDRPLSALDASANEMYRDAFHDLSCHEAEFSERPHFPGAPERIWIRKAIPLVAFPWREFWWQPWKWLRRRPVGVLFTIHDATEERRKERERKIQSAMIQEVHHRVKNNLQTVAAVLRMQIRRSEDERVRQVLRDSVGRILSMAVVHEYLSREEGQAINVREVTQRVIQQTKQGGMSPDKQIRIEMTTGHNLYLPARQATACALVINELLQNSLEHAYKTQSVGTISVDLLDQGDQVRIVVADDGQGLPTDFDLDQTTSLGLQIVQTLVQDDLRGVFEIESDNGTEAIVQFSKSILEGEEHWKERE